MRKHRVRLFCLWLLLALITPFPRNVLADVALPTGRVDIGSSQFGDIFSNDLQFFSGETVDFAINGTVDANHRFWEDRECSWWGLDCKWVRKDASRIVRPDQLPVILTASSGSFSNQPQLKDPNASTEWLVVDPQNHFEVKMDGKYSIQFGSPSDSASSFSSGYTLKGKIADKIAQKDMVVRAGCPASLCSVGQYTVDITSIIVCPRLEQMASVLGKPQPASEVTGPRFVDPLLLRFLDTTQIDPGCHPNDRKAYVANMLIDHADRFHDSASPDYLALLQKAKAIHPENPDAANKITKYFLKRGEISGAKETIGEALKVAKATFDGASPRAGKHYKDYSDALGNASEIWLKDRVAMERTDLEVALSFLGKAEEMLREGLGNKSLTADDFQVVRKEYAEKLVDQARILSLVRSDATLTRAIEKLREAQKYFPVNGRGKLLKISSDLQRGLFVNIPYSVANVESVAEDVPKSGAVTQVLIPPTWQSVEDSSSDRMLLSRGNGSQKQYGLWRWNTSNRWVVRLGHSYPEHSQAVLIPSGALIIGPSTESDSSISVSEYTDHGDKVRHDKVGASFKARWPLEKVVGSSSGREFRLIANNNDGNISLWEGRIAKSGVWDLVSGDLVWSNCTGKEKMGGGLEITESTIDLPTNMLGAAVRLGDRNALVWAKMSDVHGKTEINCAYRTINGPVGHVVFLKSADQGGIVLVADVGNQLLALHIDPDDVSKEGLYKEIPIHAVDTSASLPNRSLRKIAENEAILLAHAEAATVPRGDLVRLSGKSDLATKPIIFSVRVDINNGQVMKSSSGLSFISPTTEIQARVLDLRNGASLIAKGLNDANLQSVFFVNQGELLVHKSTVPNSLTVRRVGGNEQQLPLHLQGRDAIQVIDGHDGMFWIVSFDGFGGVKDVYVIEVPNRSDSPPTVDNVRIPNPRVGKRWILLNQMSSRLFPYLDTHVIAELPYHENERLLEGNKNELVEVRMLLFHVGKKVPESRTVKIKTPEDLVGVSIARTSQAAEKSTVFFFRSPKSFSWAWYDSDRYLEQEAGFLGGENSSQSMSYALSRDLRAAVIIKWKTEGGSTVGTTPAVLDLTVLPPKLVQCDPVDCLGGSKFPFVSDQFLSLVHSHDGSWNQAYDDAPTEFLTVLEPDTMVEIGVPLSTCITMVAMDTRDQIHLRKLETVPDLPYASWIIPISIHKEEERIEQHGKPEGVHLKKDGVWLGSANDSWDMYLWKDGSAPTFPSCSR